MNTTAMMNALERGPGGTRSSIAGRGRVRTAAIDCE
jgi:hypothetical protein